MSDLKAQDLRKTKTFDLLTTQETSLIVGGSRVKFYNSFRDLVRGGMGNDRIITGPGNDTVYGNRGNDTIVGGQGSDRLYGGAGDDVIIAGDLY